jgi:hypothetical protein
VQRSRPATHFRSFALNGAPAPSRFDCRIVFELKHIRSD